jgi:hypothetical protein
MKDGLCQRCSATQSKVFHKTDDLGTLCYSCYRWRERQRHPEQIKASKKAIYEQNKAEGKVRESWAKKNPEKAFAYGLQRRIDKADKIKETRARWYQENKASVAKKAAGRYQERRPEILEAKKLRALEAKVSEEQIFLELGPEEAPKLKTSTQIRLAFLNLPKEEKE